MSTASIVVSIAFLIFIVSFISKGIRIVQQAEVMIIERLGRFHKILNPGLHIIIPVIDQPRYFRLENYMRATIDLREQVLDFPPQPVITKDNVTMMVDSVVYIQISDPVRAMYEVSNVSQAIRQLAMTNMRNIMGELMLDETLVSRETVNTKLRIVLDEATDKWGVKVTRVEIKNIEPPHEIAEAMAKQMKAERERRAIVTEAEGIKSSQVLKAEGARDAAIAEAEGQKQSQMLRADGEAGAIERVAQAQANAIQLVYSSIKAAGPTKELIAIKYLEAMEKMANGKATKVFVPYETAGLMGSLGMLGDIWSEGHNKDGKQ